MSHVGFYPGSFDPVTNGHLDVIQRACRLVDTLYIAVGAHHEKRGFFPPDQRLSLLKASMKDFDSHGATVHFVTFSGLVVTAMRECGAEILIRGLRDTTDYNYEMQMAGMNASLAPDVQIVFLPASPNVRHIAASLVRQIAEMGGDVSGFVPACVEAEITAKVRQ